MEKKINIKSSVKLFFYGNELMLKTSKSKYLLLFGLSIFGGIISPVNALIWENFLNWLVEVLGNVESIGSMGETVKNLVSINKKYFLI